MAKYKNSYYKRMNEILSYQFMVAVISNWREFVKKNDKDVILFVQIWAILMQNEIASVYAKKIDNKIVNDTLAKAKDIVEINSDQEKVARTILISCWKYGDQFSNALGVNKLENVSEKLNSAKTIILKKFTVEKTVEKRVRRDKTKILSR